MLWLDPLEREMDERKTREANSGRVKSAQDAKESGWGWVSLTCRAINLVFLGMWVLLES